MRNVFSLFWNKYKPSTLEYLLRPDRIIETSIMIQKDDGSVQSYQAYRSQHDCIRGPYKWGLRFHQDVSRDEVMALSAWMSIKTAVVGLPLWWGKWWIIVNPKELSQTELEQLSRWFVQKMFDNIWPDVDVPAPDVNTNWQIMSWMVDEYSKLAWRRTPWVFTWKPLSIWWSQWRTQATSLWWLFVLRHYLSKNNDSLSWKTIAIQWAWNVWLHFALLAQKDWAKIVAISDSRGWIYNKNWLFVDAIADLKEQKKSVTDYHDGTKIDDDALFALDVDILVPAALENVITDKNAWDVKAPIILELANWPLTAEADSFFAKNNIAVLPDVLANAWWVTVSYFEQVQNNMNYYRDEKEVNEKLEKIMTEATDDVLEAQKTYNVDMRSGAYVVAMQKMLDAYAVRK